MIDGDKAYILFNDINFDNFTDIAITTSFGTANLYLDYWIFNDNKKRFAYLGNYAELKFDKTSKKLSNMIKINAQTYEHVTYLLNDSELIKQPE